MAAAATAPNVPNQARPWSPDFNHTDRERWICIYPAYLNNKKTLKEGRRIPKSKAVDNPVCGEIRDICAAAGLTLGVESKVYSRETEPRDIRYRGRVRVQLKNEDGTPCLPQFKDRLTGVQQNWLMKFRHFNKSILTRLFSPLSQVRYSITQGMSVMLYVVDMIPKLKSRQGQTQSTQQSSSSSASTSKGQKKKGRK